MRSSLIVCDRVLSKTRLIGIITKLGIIYTAWPHNGVLSILSLPPQSTYMVSFLAYLLSNMNALSHSLQTDERIQPMFVCRVRADWHGPARLCLCDADDEHSWSGDWSLTSVSCRHLWVLADVWIWLLGCAHCCQVRYSQCLLAVVLKIDSCGKSVFRLLFCIEWAAVCDHVRIIWQLPWARRVTRPVWSQTVSAVRCDLLHNYVL